MMFGKLRNWLACLASVALVACGGGGSDAGDSLFGDGSTTSTAAKVDVIAGGTTLGTSSSESTTITATVKDSSNNAISGATVTWAASSGTLSSQVTTTDDSGVATATFSPGSDQSNRTATITVTSGSVSGKVSVTLSGTTIAVSGTTTLAKSATSSLSFAVTDSAGNALPGTSLTVSSSLGNGLSATTLTTDSDGNASLTYTGTTAGSDTLTVTGAGATQTTTITVNDTGNSITFTSPSSGSSVAIGAAQTVEVLYANNGVAKAGQTLYLAATIGTLSTSSVTTDSSGKATATITSSFAGTSTLTATTTDGATQGSTTLKFVATTPAVLVLQADTTSLSPNSSGSSTYYTTLTAKVSDSSGNPVQGATVNFSQYADPSGGYLSAATATTNSGGQASVKYYSGASSTASAGVVLKAAVVGYSSVCSNASSVCSASLTVGGSALFIALGTGNTISNYDDQTYEKSWTVYVTDANGVRVANQTLTLKILPTQYRKGRLEWSDTDSLWVYAGADDSYPASPLSCENEDVNLNGVLDSGEDTNGDGQLTPGNAVALTASTVTTDSSGTGTIVFRYAESYAHWLRVKLTATAVVSGTESTASKTFDLDFMASDFATKTTSPPGRYSPFGVDTSTCSNAN